jgi:hypothetical protein
MRFVTFVNEDGKTIAVNPERVSFLESTPENTTHILVGPEWATVDRPIAEVQDLLTKEGS